MSLSESVQGALNTVQLKGREGKEVVAVREGLQLSDGAPAWHAGVPQFNGKYCQFEQGRTPPETPEDTCLSPAHATLN